MASKMRTARPAACTQCAVEIRSGSQDWVNVVQMPTRLAIAPTAAQRYRIQRGAMSWSGLLVSNVRKRPKRMGRSRKRMSIERHQITAVGAWGEVLTSRRELAVRGGEKTNPTSKEGTTVVRKRIVL